MGDTGRRIVAIFLIACLLGSVTFLGILVARGDLTTDVEATLGRPVEPDPTETRRAAAYRDIALSVSLVLIGALSLIGALLLKRLDRVEIELARRPPAVLPRPARSIRHPADGERDDPVPKLADDLSVTALIAHLADASSDVRRLAADALGDHGPAAITAIDSLGDTMTGGSPKTAVSAALARWRISGEPRPTLDTLVELLHHPESVVRWLALDAIVEMKSDGTAALEHVLPALRDPDRAIRSRANDYLAGLGPAAEEAVPELIDQLLNDRHDGRERAARTLAAIGAAAHDALPALSARFKEDKYADVRDAAAEAHRVIVSVPRTSLAES